MEKVKNLEGQRFERLKVKKRGLNNKYGAACWWCLCDCGSYILVRTADLKNKHVQSCGCLYRERPHLLTHGESKGFTYKTW